MPTIGQLVVNLLGDATHFNKEIAGARATTQSLTSTIGAAAAATAAMAGVAKSVQLAASFESTEAAFGVLLRDANKAKQVLADLSAFAAATPFQIGEVEAGAKQLLGYGFAAKDLIPTLRQLGDIGAALKIPLSDLIYLYGTSSTQAHIFSRDINQFASRGIPIIAELAKVLKVSKSEVMNLVENGQVNFGHLQQAITNLTSAGGQFAGTMAAAAGTMEGRYSNLQDNITIAMREIGLEITKAFDLKGVLETAINFTAQIRAAVAAYGAEVLSVIGIMVAFATGMALARAAMMAYQVATRIATASSILFQSVTNPAFVFQLAAGLIVAAVAMDQMANAYGNAEREANAAADANNHVTDSAKNAANAARGMKVEVEKLPAALEAQLKQLKYIDDMQRQVGGSLTPNVQARRDSIVGNINSMLDVGPQQANPMTPQVEALWAAWRRVVEVQRESGNQEFKLKGLEAAIGNLTGITKEIDKIKQEINTLEVGENVAAQQHYSAAGATQDQINELHRQQEMLALVKKQKEEEKEAADSAKQLVEKTRTPIEKFHAELERLQKLSDQGAIDDETFKRATKLAADEFDKANKGKKSDQKPIGAIAKGSEDAQRTIVAAMMGGEHNPNQKLEDEAKKQTKSLADAKEYLRQIATRRDGPGFEVVENF